MARTRRNRQFSSQSISIGSDRFDRFNRFNDLEEKTLLICQTCKRATARGMQRVVTQFCPKIDVYLCIWQILLLTSRTSRLIVVGQAHKS